MKNGSLHVLFTYRLFVFAALGAALPYLLFPPVALAQPAEALAPHFSGKTVTIIVGSGPIRASSKTRK